MGNLKTTTDLVYSILKQDEAARDSDEELYCRVLDHYGKRLNIDFNRVSVVSFFRCVKRAGIPTIETVGRCRRKVQEQHVDLMGTEKVMAARRDRENDFRSYARGI